MKIRSRVISSLLVCLWGAIAGAATFSFAENAQGANSELAQLADVPAVVDCASLAKADISTVVGAKVTILSASKVQDGKPAPYCLVSGNIEPHIGFEVRLPLTHWTQRFLEGGCGGLCGSMNLGLSDPTWKSCLPATNGELVVAITDMGHSDSRENEMGFQVATTDYQSRIDFAYRGQHLTVLAAKALTQLYYGQTPRYSYFVGCSDGGREALMESQRFPNDFDGIIAGDAALNFVTQNTFFQEWINHTNAGADGKAILTRAKAAILHQAVLDKCDGSDGLKDGVISDPPGCHFDPTVTLCKQGQDPSKCLTQAQVKVAQELYLGAHDSEGNKLIAGGEPLGSEVSWVEGEGDEAPGVSPIANSVYQKVVFETPLPETASIRNLKYDRETFNLITKLHPLYDASDPDLTPFASHGGKLIIFHGLTDGGMPPLMSVAYYTAVQQFIGKSKADQFLRLYLFPGGNHCSGGVGAFNVDLLTPLMTWVETGKAPYRLVASHKPSDSRLGPPGQSAAPGDEKVDFTRPVYPYPVTTKYSGTGDPNDAKNFVEGPVSAASPESLKWLGSTLYTPHYQVWCTGHGASMTCEKNP